MVPGFSTVLGFETISGPDALMNPAMLGLTDVLGLPRIWDWRIKVKEEEFAAMHRALDMLNVRYILDAPDRGGRALPGTKVLSAADLTVFESETAWPRAFFTDTIGVYNSGAELRQLVEEGDGRPFAAQPGPLQAKMPLPARDFAHRIVQPAHHYRLTNNTTSFEIDAPTSGMAVLSEAIVPDDILAYVDGQPTLCLPVDHAFRGVLIPTPGHHEVKFEYWPAVLDHALNLGLLGLVALALSFWWWWRAGRTVPQVLPAQPVQPEFAPLT
jgi:hypothetical protein